MNRKTKTGMTGTKAGARPGAAGTKAGTRAGTRAKILVSAALIAIAVIVSFTASNADSALLTPGTSTTLAGTSFGVTLNLGSLDIDSSVDENQNQFTVTLSVDPSGSAISVEEGVGDIKANGEYHITSAQLDGLTTLHFWVTPPEDLTEETTYSVTVYVDGSIEASDSFSFVAVPIPTSDDQGQGDDPSGQGGEQGGQGDNPGGQGDVPGGQDNPGGDGGNGQVPGGDPSGGNGGNGKMPDMKGNSKTPSGFSGGSISYGSYSASASVTYEGSWDNYLDSLSVDGYEFTKSFNKTRDTYFLTVPEDVESLDVEATPSDDSATVVITGDDELPMGRSKIMISVTAEDDSVRIYRIYVDRVTAEEYASADEEDEMPSFPQGMDGSGMPTPPEDMDWSEMPDLPKDADGNVIMPDFGQNTEDTNGQE